MGEELKLVLSADDKASEKVGGLSKALGGLGSLASGALTVGLGVAAGGLAGLGAELFASVQAASDAEGIAAQLAAVLKSTGGVAGVTAQQANDLATSLSGVTRFEDDAIVGGESLLLTFTNIGSDVFPAATETMLNMSQAMGQDLKSSAIQLGKALNDPIAGVSALSRVGVQFTDAQKDQIKAMVEAGDVAGAQKLILKELETEMGGAARAAGETFAGKLDILKNKFGNIQETIGAAILPSLTRLGEKFAELLDKPEVQAAITRITNWIADNLPKAVDTAMQLLDELTTNGIPGVLAKAQEWANAPETQKMLSDVGKWIGQGIGDGIKTLLSDPATSQQALDGLASMMRGMAANMGDIFKTVGGAIGAGIWQGVWEALTGRQLTEQQAAAFQQVVMRLFQTYGGIPGMAGGGRAAAGRAVIVGEEGPELLVPDVNGTVIPNGRWGSAGAGAMVVINYAPMLSMVDERELTDRLQPVILAGMQRAAMLRTA